MKIIIAITTGVVTFIVLIFVWPHQPSQQLVAAPEVDSSAVSIDTPILIHHTNQVTGVTIFAIPNLSIQTARDEYRSENLQFYPIYASTIFIQQHSKFGPYLTLDKALKQNKLLITERNGAEDVNQLFMENTSADTVIILAGEVVRGGKQDRMIAQDFLVLPHSGKIDLDVYCVEHSRWQADEENVRAVFDATVGIAPNSVREAVKVEEAQQEVWNEVSEMKAAYDVEETSDALFTVLEDADRKDYVQPYLDHFLPITWPKNVVGLIAVMDNQIVGCDIFAKHELFKEYYATLVASYCGKVHQSKYDMLMPHAKVTEFFQQAFANENTLEKKILENGTQLKHRGHRLHVALY